MYGTVQVNVQKKYKMCKCLMNYEIHLYANAILQILRLYGYFYQLLSSKMEKSDGVFLNGKFFSIKHESLKRMRHTQHSHLIYRKQSDNSHSISLIDIPFPFHFLIIQLYSQQTHWIESSKSIIFSILKANEFSRIIIQQIYIQLTI